MADAPELARSARSLSDLRTATALVAVLEAVRGAHTAGGVIEALPRPLVERLGVYAARAIGRVRGAPIVAEYARDAREGEFFGSRLEDTCIEAMAANQSIQRRFASRQLRLEIAFVAAPLHDESGLTVGAVGIACAVRTATDLEGQLANLDAVARLVELAPSWNTVAGRASVADDAVLAQASQLGKAAAYESDVALAFALTNNLCTRLDCELVAIGLAEGPTVRVLSVSGFEDVREESPAVEALRMAMGEGIDLERRASAPASELESGHRVPALLAAWHHKVGGSVAVIPLLGGDGPRGVVALRRAPGLTFEPAELDRVAELIGPYLPALELLRRASRGLPRHVADTGRAQLDALRRAGAWGRRAIVAAIALFGLWFLFGSLPHSLSVPCEVRASEVSHLAAPFEGVLRAAPFTPGGRVREGDVLAVFDTSFEELQRAHLLAEMDVLEVDLRQALAGDDALSQRRLEQQRASLSAQLALSELRLGRARITAPFDGVVLSGDLRDRIGDTLAQGEDLFELAPGDGWRVELLVAEKDALEVAVGQTGLFSTRARPEVRHGFEVEHVGGAVESVHGAAVLRLEAAVTDQVAWVRPGMTGSAQLRVAGRAPWKKVTGPLIDWLRLRFVL
ncbi:efflux RND transporter periplasmic adaptor subunit [Engelhardtia mirabilis]|uniref:Cobalt-zinc-cadmium resistance protein CzcB n=1 Tax=Engelhardtia mirabilis TaxID=2528011 RepID=A0A518BNI7_9BACT|nr:Cobalt-zinc-cadmium resistance protein CzcB [Planctomycetes bacterium Pla133]QDV02869.1 Cobalt-zinc-cadmium resistance protein CzcB [Planctomycetes bacterium Pla86]